MYNNGIEDLRNLKKKICEISNSEDTSSDILSARARINELFDDGTFVELDVFAKDIHKNMDIESEEDIRDLGAGVICGYGKVDGRLVYAYSQDSYLGGAITEVHALKIVRLITNAVKMGAPIIGFYDSMGAKIEESLGILAAYGAILRKSAKSYGVVPQISAIMGPCYGANSMVAGISDFILAREDNAEMFMVGPKLIDSPDRVNITRQELGGAETLSKQAGNVQLTYKSDIELIQGIKKLLSYLPSNNMTVPPDEEGFEEVVVTNKLNDFAQNELSNDIYDVRDIIREIADNGDYFELSRYYGTFISIGFMRLNGKVVGVVANTKDKDPKSLIHVRSAKKAIKFINTCDSYNIPILSIVDIEEFYIESVSSGYNMMKLSSQMAFAYASAVVPKVSLIVKKAYGSAYLAMGTVNTGADLVLAWPSASISELAPRTAASIIAQDKLKKAKDVVKTREELISEYERKISSPYNAASRGLVDDVIEPKYTRLRLIDAFDMLYSKRDASPVRKHDLSGI